MKSITVLFEGTLTFPTGYASSKSKKKDVAKKTEYQALPTMAGKFIIPGEQLAGALRRAGMDDFRDAFQEDPLTSILSFYQARVGGIAGFGKTYKLGEVSELRKKNPFISLWGKAGVRGLIGMGHAVGPDTETATVCQGQNGPYKRTVSNADRVHGFRSDDLSRDPEIVVPMDFWKQRDALKQAGKSPDAAKKVALYSEKADFLSFVSDDTESSVSDDSEDADASVKKLTNIQNGYGGFEYLPNSTKFSHNFSVTGTESELFMLMASFCGFAKNPRLGGHWRHNMGWVDMRYAAYIREDDLRLAPREVGTVAVNSHIDDLSAPALATTGLVSEWMDTYLSMRQQGFPGIDINEGVGDEYKVIKENLKKIMNSANKATKKSSKQQIAEDENHVA